MKVLPVAVNRYDGLSKINRDSIKHYNSDPSKPECVSFKGGGKSILGGFIAGVVGTVALSAVAPLAILGAGVAGIGGALLGNAIGGSSKKKS